LWVANWKVSSPKIPSGWSNWVFWQYTDAQKVPGINAEAADGDVFHGSETDLKAFAESHGSQGAGTGPVTAPEMPTSTGTSPRSNAGNPIYAPSSPGGNAPGTSVAPAASSPLGNLLNNFTPQPQQPPAQQPVAQPAPAETAPDGSMT